MINLKPLIKELLPNYEIFNNATTHEIKRNAVVIVWVHTPFRQSYHYQNHMLILYNRDKEQGLTDACELLKLNEYPYFQSDSSIPSYQTESNGFYVYTLNCVISNEKGD